jgi:phosphoribosylformylglycinamidine cyclo-ligase
MKGLVAGIGGFGAQFPLDVGRWPNPVLVSSTDGVGTKLRIAIDTDRPDSVGIDLVAMCVNDLVVQGAAPLFFLDYFATGALDVTAAARVIAGIAQGCKIAGCALVGGETAEMPGMYHGKDYDLAGFSVGVVEKDRIIDGSRTAPGDVVLGLPSSGPHSNGFSLIRKILEISGAQVAAPVQRTPLIDRLMAPTRIYVKPLLELMAEIEVHGVAHITGGGLVDNVPRVLPDGLEAVLERRAWSRDPVFEWLQREGRVADGEMYRVFNCGIGMTLQVGRADADRAMSILNQAGQPALVIGEVRAGTRGLVIS